MKNIFIKCIEQAESIAIGGHVRPDGDCVGSCMGLYYFIANKYSDKTVDVFLKDIPECFDYIVSDEALEIKHKGDYDLFISLDCGDKERLDYSAEYFDRAKDTIAIDHHISNTKYANHNHVVADASSTSELLCDLLPISEMNTICAESFYTGIIHDTGVFKHSCTGKKTMELTGRLIEKGFNFGKIIDESFYQTTYRQLRCVGYCMNTAKVDNDGKFIYSYADNSFIEEIGAKSGDFEGAVDHLRTTKGVEVAALLTEFTPGEVKVSMRANQYVDVSSIAVSLGGGGHVKAAGFTLEKSIDEVLNILKEKISEALNGRNN